MEIKALILNMAIHFPGDFNLSGAGDIREGPLFDVLKNLTQESNQDVEEYMEIAILLRDAHVVIFWAIADDVIQDGFENDWEVRREEDAGNQHEEQRYAG